MSYVYNDLNEWVECTGFVAKGTSYYYELQCLIDAAYELGFAFGSAEIEKLRSDREKLVAMGKFYASLDNWTEEDGGVYDGKTAVVFSDSESLTFVCDDDENPSTDTFGGKLARTTLKELGEME